MPKKYKNNEMFYIPKIKKKWGLGCFAALIVYVWAFYYFFVSPFGFRWQAIFGEKRYPSDYEINGIDISHHQGTINWEKLKTAKISNNPVSFVMIKATEGMTVLDRKFNENFYNAKEYGFLRGAYHFWSNKSSARDQAYFFISKVRLENGDLPPILDVEHKPNNMSNEEFQLNILTWLHIVEDKYRTKPIIYTYYKFKEMYLSDQRFDGYPYWIAHYYVEKLQYQGQWKFWQHTDAGKLPGIRTYVDLNIYNGSYYDLTQLTVGNDNY